MMVLLDTSALLWLWAGDARLGRQARETIDIALQNERLAVSAISFWEVAMLKDKGRLDFPEDIGVWRQELLGNGLIEVPVTGDVAARGGALSGIHGDPGDRLIVATALEGHRLITSDTRILSWAGTLDRLNARV